jgi:hydrogenase expression/formation protein HypD
VKYLDEYRDERAVRGLLSALRRETKGRWAVMEVCGGQTHSIMRHGLDRLLPEGIELLHGPGCPVCVTPVEAVDRAHAIASRPEVVFCSFGDMLRVPGSHGDLLSLKARGADVRIVYSPLDAVRTGRSFSSRSGLRPPRPRTRWPFGRRSVWASRIFLFWFPRCWSRR